MKESNGERLFRKLCERFLSVQPVQEHKFYPGRRWRFDFAFIPVKVAVEVDGGTWVSGRHNRPSSTEAEYEKFNAAAEEGWLVFRYTPGMLESDPIGIMQQLASATSAAFYEPQPR